MARQIFFYEHEFYVFSNFSSFRLLWQGVDFDTSEHAYHWEKFPDNPEVRELIINARSAHDAFKVAQKYKATRRPDWDEVKVSVMRDILKAKLAQHSYVRKKLVEAKGCEIIEDSWRDDFWGWGPNKDGQNQLGKLWMELSKEI